MFRSYQLAITLAITLLSVIPATSHGFDYLQPLPDKPLIPADNPQTEHKIALGKRLFFDTSLLGPKSTLSCNSCHTLASGGDDNRPYSIGQNGRISRRSAPGLFNIGLQTVLYWDGRSTSLEDQALDHLRNPLVSAWPSIGSIISYLEHSSDYKAAFEKAFPNNPVVSGINLARALASFERSLLSSGSPFDRYIRGDKAAISDSAKRGIQAFNDNGCLACHFGVNFAGPAPGPAMNMGDGFYELFPNTRGSSFDRKYQLTDDLGRYEFTGDPGEKYMWRVPSLRNIELTAPYFHNGSVSTLEEAIRVMAKTQTERTPSDETVRDISAFLRSLTGKIPGSIQ
ncbi:cytochrome-c peroxidase [Kaarinaea lacus]